jgi:molybdopterin synthase catalytic subunit
MIRLVEQSIDPKEIIETVVSSASGAVVTFDGRVRDHSRGRRVTHLFYEAYVEMAEAELEKLRSQAMERWDLSGLAIVHRLGRLEVGETSVFIAATAAHRAEAFDACRSIIDTLKKTVPIWKKEYYVDGEVWVETPGTLS